VEERPAAVKYGGQPTEEGWIKRRLVDHDLHEIR
jgi:hypothetical protein